jgi:16S rRNA (cytidine1402-2'-O)-methyltransferase
MDKRWTRSGTIYLVATPIGNLADMSARAADVLREADLIAMEDTRVSLPWLRRIGVAAPSFSYHEHSGPERTDALVAAALSGQIVALISDAGLPAVSDPGREVVERAWETGVPISVIPGPSAGISAYAGSGFPLPVTLWGFLPARGRARSDALERVLEGPGSQVLYEAPTRTARLLEECSGRQPGRTVVVVRELSKLHEEWWRGSLAAASEQFGSSPVRGEVTLVLGPTASQPVEVDWDAVLSQVDVEVGQGRSPREAIQLAAREAGVRRQALYQRWHTRQTT